MKSIGEYKSKRYGYYNSLHSSISEPVYLNESLVINRGKEIDSIFHKMNIYEYRQTHGSYIHESYKNVDFNIDEQFAARDMFINIAESYAETLCEEFCNEYDIISEGISWQDIKNGTKKFVDNVSDTAKKLGNKVKDAYEELKTKLKEVYQFVKDVVSKAIKTAKEMVDRFLDMLTKMKQGINELLEKFGANIKEVQEEIKQALDEALKNKSKRPKENIYENLGLTLKYGDNLENINEGWFSRKNKTKDQQEQGQEDPNDKKNNPKKPNVYDEAGNAKAGEEKKGGGWKKFLLGLLKQICISVIVLLVIPAIAGCIWGPAVALVVGTIAKAAMSGYAFIKLIKNIKDTIKSGDFKKFSKTRKVCTILMWVLMLGLIAWGAKGFMKDAGKIMEAWSTNTLGKLVPDEGIQACMKIINDIWKAITGKDTAGYTELMKVVNGGLVRVDEITTKAGDAKGAGSSESFSKDAEKAFDNVMKNANDGKGIPASKYVDGVKNNWGSMSDSFSANQEYIVGNVKFPGGIEAIMKDPKAAEALSKLKDLGLDYKTLVSSNSSGTTYSGFFSFPKGTDMELAQKTINGMLKAVAGNGETGLLGPGTLGAAAETVTTSVTSVISAVTGTFVPVVAIPDYNKKHQSVGKFRIRMGSARTLTNDLYVVDAKECEFLSLGDAKEKYGDKNKAAFDTVEKMIVSRHEALKQAKEKLESKEKLSSEEKKLLKDVSKQLDKTKEGANNYKGVVFISEAVQEPKKEVSESLKYFEAKEETEETKIEAKPVIYFDTLTLNFIDLTDCRAARKNGKPKGPRKKPIAVKGLLSSYEFLPVDEGASTDTIIDYISGMIGNALNGAVNTLADMPFVKDGKKYKVNENSNIKGERKDVGGLTNEEIVEVMNDTTTEKASLKKYFGGSYKRGSSTVENENTEFTKKRKENARKEWINNIETNDEVKEIIKNSKTLHKLAEIDDDGNVTVDKDELYKLTDALLRFETTYDDEDGGENKKSFWQKVKNFFTGKNDDDDNKGDYDKKELRKLAWKLAELHNKRGYKRKKKIEETRQEEYEGEYEDLCERLYLFNSNMYLLEESQINESLTEYEYYEDEF